MNKRKTLILLGSFAAFFLLISVTYILFEWYPLTDGPPNEASAGYGFGFVMFTCPIIFILAVAWMAALFVVPISLIGSIFFKGKTRSVLLVICAIFFMAFLTFEIPRFINPKIRKAALIRMTQRGEVIIQAIESYRAKENKPPKALEDLVPEYIDKIPGTGIRGYPAYEYAIPETAWKYSAGYYDILEVNNAVYELRVNFPAAGSHDDFFIYWPTETYPDQIYRPTEAHPHRGYGGPITLINKWAYIHE